LWAIVNTVMNLWVPYKATPSHYISVRSILMAHFHLRLGLPNGLAFLGFPKFRVTCLVSPHLLPLDFISLVIFSE